MKLFELQSREPVRPGWKETVIQPIETNCIAARLQIDPEVAKHFCIEAIDIDRHHLLAMIGEAIPAMMFAGDGITPSLSNLLLVAGQSFSVSVHNVSSRALKFEAEVWGSLAKPSSSAAG